MRKIHFDRQINLFDVISLFLSFLFTAGLYLFLINKFDGFFPPPESLDRRTLIFSFLIIDGGAAFLSLLLGLLVVTNRFKIIAGTFLMGGLFAVNINADILVNAYTLVPFLDSLLRLMFTAIGALLANSIWGSMAFRQLKRRSGVKAVIEHSRKKKYRISTLLLLLALVSVPLTYGLVFIFACIPLGLIGWILLLALQIPTFHYYLWVVIVIIMLLGSLITFRTLGTFFLVKSRLQPGLKIDLAQTPHLKEAIQDVCTKLHTRMPDVVVLLPEPNMFVLQGKMNTFDGIVKGRILSIGVPLLQELEVNELKALLAHEFAFLSGKDWLYHKYVVPLYRTFDLALHYKDSRVARRILDEDKPSIFNIFVHVPNFFIRLFYYLYATLDSILLVGRQLRADGMAAGHYGSRHFSTALVKQAQLTDYFNEVSYQLPFSEEDFFKHFHALYHENPDAVNAYKEKALAASDSLLKPSLQSRLQGLPEYSFTEVASGTRQEINDEIDEKAGRLSLIFQYVRDINRYYKELNRLLKGYKGIVFEEDLSNKIFARFRKSKGKDKGKR